MGRSGAIRMGCGGCSVQVKEVEPETLSGQRTMKGAAELRGREPRALDTEREVHGRSKEMLKAVAPEDVDYRGLRNLE